MFFSIIIPVYNRPDELSELLQSLTEQVFDKEKIRWEIIVVEDGSNHKSDKVVEQFQHLLPIRYFDRAENVGQGFTRNFAYQQAQGDYFIVFDSDCIVPPDYLQKVYDFLQKNYLDAYGGPDTAHQSFTDTQKAISYAMTSIFSTGGIRGNRKSAERFRPRSFNMGISRQVFEKTGGYIITRMGEDIEFSIRIEKNGFRVGLIPNAFVYHKRRTSFRQFAKQLHFFGRGRINISRFHPEEIKLVHFFPAFFVLFLLSIPLQFLFFKPLAWVSIGLLGIYKVVIFIDALLKIKSFKIAFMSVWAVFIQLTSYGIGFLQEWWRKIREKN
ncbi:MAG: glycosyltransferase [Raineya sp.]|nr:glycosyltransferase [Raineya sp.]MDW8296320.1 glycosyltransferase [Raineya sp.]